VQRGYKQRAAFLSLDFDLIPKVLTVTAGARFYHYDEFEHGSEYYSETTSSIKEAYKARGESPQWCLYRGPRPLRLSINLDKSESGPRLRGNLTWHVTPDIMAYYTYFGRISVRAASIGTNSLPGQTPILSGVAGYCGAGSTDPRCLPAEASPVKIPASSTSPLALARTS